MSKYGWPEESNEEVFSDLIRQRDEAKARVKEAMELLDTANVPNADWWAKVLAWADKAGIDSAHIKEPK